MLLWRTIRVRPRPQIFVFVSPLISRIPADLHPQADVSAIHTSLVDTIVKSETVINSQCSCQPHPLPLLRCQCDRPRSRLMAACWLCVDMVEGGDKYVNWSKQRHKPLVGHEWKGFSNRTWTPLRATPSTIFSSNRYQRTWETDFSPWLPMFELVVLYYKLDNIKWLASNLQISVVISKWLLYHVCS